MATNLDDLDWYKSSRSGRNGDCVETAPSTIHGDVHVRDSKNKGTVLTFSTAAFGKFINSVKSA